MLLVINLIYMTMKKRIPRSAWLVGDYSIHLQSGEVKYCSYAKYLKM